MGGWPAIIKEALEWLRKAAPALFAYLAGRKSKAHEQERDNAKAVKDTLDDEREIHHRRNDANERHRVRNQYARPKPPEDTQ